MPERRGGGRRRPVQLGELTQKLSAVLLADRVPQTPGSPAMNGNTVKA